MLRSTRILGLAVALAALAATPAAAQTAPPVSLVPADGVTIDADAFPPFSARGDGALTVRLARTPAACSTAARRSRATSWRSPGTPAAGDPTLQTFVLPATLAPRASGTGRWCAAARARTARCAR